MSSSDFEAQLRQSVADNLALISNAAQAAKSRIGQSVAAGAPAPQAGPADLGDRRPAVDFAADEPHYPEQEPYGETPAFGDEPAFAAPPTQGDVPMLAHEHAPLPQGAINVDEFSMESVDDEGIPVWEDPT